MTVNVREASIADLRAALETGRASAVSLLEAYLDRIAAYDGQINSIVVVNPSARADAEAS
ncbi:MAG: amidase, partial [Mycolicibacterium sp.]|nr:amidase [Mycolicibacterium sp.]